MPTPPKMVLVWVEKRPGREWVADNYTILRHASWGSEHFTLYYYGDYQISGKNRKTVEEKAQEMFSAGL